MFKLKKRHHLTKNEHFESLFAALKTRDRLNWWTFKRLKMISASSKIHKY